MKKFFYMFAFFLFGMTFITAAAAQEAQLIKGTEQPVTRNNTNDGSCYIFSNYVIKTTTGESVGEDVYVYKINREAKPASHCASATEPFLSIDNVDANYFAGISGNFLFIDSGTSTESRGLEIYDLTKKKSVYTTEYHQSVKLQNKRFILYDRTSEKGGAIRTCREAQNWKKNGLSIGWVKPAKLNLETLEEAATGPLKCVAQQ